MNHRVSSQSRFTRRRAYQWGANHRLKGIVNELNGVRTAFGYDEFSNLVWSNQGGQFDFLHRSVDDVGNLYETKDKKDRVYGAGSRLLETTDTTFSYDEEGNLVQKVEKKSGATWQYAYYGNGMLAKVINPDHTAVTFKYDALGRRVEKRSNEKTTAFIWDGNTILHKYFSDDYSERYYEFIHLNGEPRVAVIHTNDPNPHRIGPTHAHAGMVHKTKRIKVRDVNGTLKYKGINMRQ